MKGQQDSSKNNWGGSRRGAGRPELKASARRKNLAAVRLNDSEMATFTSAANRAKIGLSEWIRLSLLLVAAQP